MMRIDCPVCAGTRVQVFVERRDVPVHQNLIVQDTAAARSVKRGDLKVVVCEDCGFVFNQAFDPATLEYGENYDATNTISSIFESHMDRRVRDMVEVRGVRDARIVEVGCGNGSFLRKLVNYPASQNRGIGFDPSYRGSEIEEGGRLMFHRSFYDASCTDVPADIVVCRHVIEHTPEPLTLLRSVRSAMTKSLGARVFFETPCVEWVLRNRVVWDFFYEHCSLFSARSLATAFERTGFDVVRVEHVFDEQYLWLEATVALGGGERPATSDGTTVARLCEAYGADEKALQSRYRTHLSHLRQRGRVALWGAGAKGATLANLVDPDCSILDCVVDINPNKQGHFIPGTGHPIVPPLELRDRSIGSIILMNTSYRAENQTLLSRADIRAELIDWRCLGNTPEPLTTVGFGALAAS